MNVPVRRWIAFGSLIFAFTLPACQPPRYTLAASFVAGRLFFDAEFPGIWPLKWDESEVGANYLEVVTSNEIIWAIQASEAPKCTTATENPSYREPADLGFPLAFGVAPRCYVTLTPAKPLPEGTAILVRAHGAVTEGSGQFKVNGHKIVAVPMTVDATVADAVTRPTPPVPAAGQVTGDALCAAGETPFFSCEIGAKLVALCGGGSGAVYRYGTPGKVELTARSLSFASQGYSGGGESQITARNDDYTYTVYDRTLRTAFGAGGNDPDFSSGLVISRGKRVISSKMCKSESSIDADAKRTLPAGGFVEH